MQIDFAMNIYAACEAGARRGKCGVWRGMPEQPLALLFAWNNNRNIYNLPVGAVLAGRVFLVPGGPWGGGRAGPVADLECAEHP